MADVVIDTGISPGWANIAKGWIGIESGKHCHWCRSIRHNDGCSYCNNPNSKFSDGHRIRSWDGEECAEDCGVFELNEHYKDDRNIDG